MNRPALILKFRKTPLLLAIWGLLPGAVPLHAQDNEQSNAYVGNNEPMQLFGEKCGMCHRVQGMGTTLLQRRYDPEQALLENRRDLAPEFIRSAVRSGFNNMFPISRGEVSDLQLDHIISYLTQERGE
jgi:cytochrome c5